MNKMKNTENEKKYLAFFILMLSLTSCLFVITQIISSTMNYDSKTAHILSYFTMQSNIIIIIWTMALSLYILTGKKSYKFSMDINLASSFTTYILVTGLVYWAILVPVYFAPDATWLFSTSNIWLHTFSPVISIIVLKYVKSQNDGIEIKPKLPLFFIYPVLYIIFALINAANRIFLYPMFNPNLLGGWIGVAICLIVMIVLFTGLYLLLLYGPNRKKKIN
ncbi:MAG: hypothetical protein AB1Z23_00030 [Eubacteriales bacterium]